MTTLLNCCSRRLVVVAGAAAVASVTSLGAMLAVSQPTRGQAPVRSGSIHGHVAALLQSDTVAATNKLPRRIELPDAAVTATNVQTQLPSAAVTTNAHGYYQIHNLPSGTYQVCATLSGFTDQSGASTKACLPGNVTVTDFNVVVGEDVRLKPKSPFIFGRVLLADKARTPCFADRPAFHTFVTAKVTLDDAGNKTLSGPVTANGIGEYILPSVNVPAGSYEVVAVCENGSARAPYTAGPAETFRDVIIGNAPPRMLRVEATANNKSVRIASPGSSVTLSAVAQHPSGRPMRFKWVDSNGKDLGGPTASIDLKLPPDPSSSVAFVEASDGRGGFAYGQIPLTGGAPQTEALFTGRVLNASTLVPVASAQVTVNGAAVSTDGKGLFTVSVPTGVRYTVSVRKPGFALLSKVTYSPAAQLFLALEPVQPVPIPSLEKGGMFGSRLTDKQSMHVLLTLPPNSLIHEDKTPATGPGLAYIWRYPAGTPIPGDMSAALKDKPRLETFGALDIVLTDSSGRRLQLEPGAQITVTMAPNMPPPPQTLPPTMPFFLFDEAKGLWMPHGILTLSGNQYTGTISHLTAFNADLASGTTGCIEYHVDVENSPPLPFYLHIEQGGTSANHEPFEVSDFAGVVSRLRPGQSPDWWALPTPTSPKADAIGHGTVTPFPSNFTSDPADPNGDFPAVGARDASNQPICTSFTITANFPGHETYLTGLAGPPTLPDEANYKNAVTAWAGSARATLTDFKNANGFPNADEATAVYFNDGDLKLGRDMHCRLASGGRIACYVTNYLNGASPPAGAAPVLLSATSAHNGGSDPAFATVAMEWDPGKGDDTAVQFYVYNGHGDQVTEATLDSEGAKPVPQICLACHGGDFHNGSMGDNLAHGARFLPFDIASFLMVDDEFGTAAVSALGLDAFTRLNQLGQFRALNALVRQAAGGPPSANTAITDLIDGWYGGCGGVNSGTCGTCVGGAPLCPDSFRGNFRPSAWQSASTDAQTLYDVVVRPTCRGCHNTQPSFDWTDPGQFTSFPSVRADVCTNTQRRMPHGEVPFKAFWHTSTRPTQMTLAPESSPTCDR
jgi:hypothetical protein